MTTTARRTTSGNGGSSDLPMTFQEAEEQGVDDIDWGDGCDTDRGRIAIPVNNAAPCVEPWDGRRQRRGHVARA